MVSELGQSPDEIDDLARRAKAGDRDALESLLAAVRPRTLAICRGVLPYNSDAEDACQEALIKVAQKIGTWNQRGRFTTWLHVVAVNSARSTYRLIQYIESASRASIGRAAWCMWNLGCVGRAIWVMGGPNAE